MIDHPTRTRWLHILDNLIMTDRQGAIDDMLQVLREHGVIQDIFAEDAIANTLAKDNGYVNAAMQQVASMIGFFLMKKGIIKFEKTNPDPFQTNIRGIATVVVKGNTNV